MEDGEVIYGRLATGHAIARHAAFVVLDALKEKGVEGAEELEAQLSAINPDDHPLDSDMFAVASHFQRRLAENQDETEKVSLKKLVSYSYATAGLAVAQAVCELRGSNDPQTFPMQQAANNIIATASLEMSYETHQIFLGLLEEIRSRTENI